MTITSSSIVGLIRSNKPPALRDVSESLGMQMQRHTCMTARSTRLMTDELNAVSKVRHVQFLYISGADLNQREREQSVTDDSRQL